MSYVSLSLDGHPVVLPERRSDDEHVQAALEALVQAAAPCYNRALQAHADNNAVEALQSIESALRLAPYSVQIVEASVALALRHGLFDAARARLQWADDTGMSADWPDYEGALHEAVQRWNLFLEDTTALRTHYQNPEADACYRELLLLADHLHADAEPPITGAERAHLEAFGCSIPEDSVAAASVPATAPSESPASVDSTPVDSTSAEPTPAPEPASASEPEPEPTPAGWLQRQPVMAAGLAGAVGLLLGIGGMWMGGADPNPTTTASPSVATATPPAPSPGGPTAADKPEALRQAATLAQAQVRLLQGDPLTTHAMLDTLTVSGEVAKQAAANLQQATNQALYETGIAAWARGDTEAALQRLRLVGTTDVGAPQERLYALGMAAAAEGEPQTAIDALTRLQDHLTPAWAHYDAQAAYTLVQLLPDTEARPYAERIASRYADTIYNNSVVQAHR